MNPSDLLSHFREQYNTEVARKEGIGQRLGIVTAILVLQGNIIVSIATSFQFIPFKFWHCFFYVPFGVGFFVCIATAVYIGWVLFRAGRYTYIPTADQTREYVLSKTAAGLNEAEISAALQKNLINVYAFCATANFKLTTARNKLVLMSIRLAIISLAAILLSLPAYLAISRGFPDKSIKVELLK